jgi:hypothetical protein
MTDSNTHSNLRDSGQTPGETVGETSGDTLGDTLGGPRASTTEKDPADWVTGDEPMTGAQRSYLDTLARENGEELSADLTKAEASEQIDRLQQGSDRAS